MTLILGANDIPFTQYLRPDGRQRECAIERSPDIVAKARAVQQAGYHFDIEELMDRTVSMTVESNLPNNDEQALIAIELCPNGPEVLEAVDRLVTTAYERVMGGRAS